MARTSPFTDLTALVSRFHSEDKCREYLEQLRWPDGVRCPRCHARKGISRIETRGQFECNSCGYQFSVRVGTVFHDSHLPLWKWFLAVYVMGHSQHGVSANQLRRMLGLSYKTAWYLCHRIRSAMKDEASQLMRRMVDAGGAFNPETLHQFLSDVLADDAEAIDAVRGYLGLGDGSASQTLLNHSDMSVQGDTDTNAIESVGSLFKRSVAGSYHHRSAKHLPAYLDEIAFRYNNRENAYLFRDTLRRLIGADSIPYAELIATP